MGKYKNPTADTNNDHDRGWASSGLDRFLGFWFKPTDLTTIAAIRICAGALFLYILRPNMRAAFAPGRKTTSIQEGLLR